MSAFINHRVAPPENLDFAAHLAYVPAAQQDPSCIKV